MTLLSNSFISFEMDVMDKTDDPESGEDNLQVVELRSEPVQPQKCCRCGISTEKDPQVFDCDSCSHTVCLACRFKDDMPCKLCGGSDVTTKTETTNPNESLFIKNGIKKKFNIDHIVDVEVTTTDGVFMKQMCTVCKRVFKKSNARYHYTCASKERPFSCTKCGKMFVKKSHMQSHLNNHLGIKPFKCSFRKCKASFTHHAKLARHLKSHNKDKKFTCSICQKEYTTQAILAAHIKKVHNSTTKSFQCELCPRSYKYKQSLHVHLLKHNAVREFMCEVCGKKYALIAQLKAHKRSHMVYHRRPYKCWCGRRFISRHNRARHRLIHSTSRDFECSICKTTFGRKDNLERHMKNFHQVDHPLFLKTKPTASVTPSNKKSCKSKNENKINKVKKTPTNKQAKMNPTNKYLKNKNNAVLENKLSVAVETIKNVDFNPQAELSMKECVTESIKEQGNSKEPPVTPTVIVLSKPNENQNRASVIKSVPKLLPYRVLPPDKRFLKMTEEVTKGKSPSELMPPPVGNGSRLKNTSGTIQTSSKGGKNGILQKQNCISQSSIETPVSKPLPKEKPAQSQRRRLPKDDALNRCFRIIRHTSSVNINIPPVPQTSPEYSKQFVVINPNESLIRTSGKFTPVAEGIINTSIDQIGISTLTNCSYIPKNVNGPTSSFTAPSDTMDPCSTKPIGGPTLPSSISENTCYDGMQEETFPNTYTNLTDVPSFTSYTPYFDSECFKENENSYYEGNVDNLLPNDLDMGFQFGDEHLDCAEINFPSDCRNVSRYVSQEPKTARDTLS